MPSSPHNEPLLLSYNDNDLEILEIYQVEIRSPKGNIR